MFNKIKKISIAHRKGDEAIYSIVAQEMEKGVRNSGLWLKALEEAQGNKEKQVAEYIKLRVQSLKDDMSIHSESIKSKKHIFQSRNIEEFVTILSGDCTVKKVEEYFFGMNTQEINNFINQPDACEEYPIHISIKKGRLDLAKWLLWAGADPNLRNYWGKTALEIAEQKEDKDAIALLEQQAT